MGEDCGGFTLGVAVLLQQQAWIKTRIQALRRTAKNIHIKILQ